MKIDAVSGTLPTLNVLGIPVTVLNLPGAVALIECWLWEDRRGRYVCVTGVHGVMESLRTPAVRQAHLEADAVVPDGMPLVWLGRLHGHNAMGRVYGPDLMLAVLERAAHGGWTNYFYGGQPGVAQALSGTMQQRFPGLRVAGVWTPPMGILSPEEERAALADINGKRPDLLWVGLSTPRQECQMAAWRKRVAAKVMLGVGAAFDFHTGRLRQAPRWLQRVGLEWLFRLAMEPGRLWKRYLVNNPLFLWHIGLQLTGLRRYPPPSRQARGTA